MNGILLVDKPIFYTSHDVVDVVRRKLKIRRVGHAGSLDPMATGLVVILVGEATRAFVRYAGQDKEYEGIVTLGLSTETHDLEGRVTGEEDAAGVETSRIRCVFEELLGPQDQTIPRFSAAKVGGQKCYEMARRNIGFDQPVKRVEVKALRLLRLDPPDVCFFAHVSKGTYMRALADEIGRRLGTRAVLSCLRRTRSGPHTIRQSLTVRAIRNLSRDEVARRLFFVKRDENLHPSGTPAPF